MTVVRVLDPRAAGPGQPTDAAGRGVDDRLAVRLATLRRLRGPAVTGFASRVREIVLVASSSRGGSSMLAETLRGSPFLLHLSAEMNPFLRLVGLAFPAPGCDSDRLDAGHLHALHPLLRQVLDEELALDAGCQADTVDDEQFLLDAAWRFAVQWPGLDVDVAGWLATAGEVLGELRRECGWGPGELPDVAAFEVALLRRLAADGLLVDPAYYDLPGTPPPDGGAGRRTRGAPGEVLVEEPPFVLPRVWRRADERDLRTKALVIKTPSNAYRLAFLRALFPNARVRVLHLTRNPAASINGLYDGWRHTGFHAHRMREPLRIAGYAEDCPGDRWWWKFDLPPGWQDFTDAPLLEVCAFQWRSPHQAVLDDVERGDVDYLRVRFEDVIRGPHSRAACFQRLGEWLGIPFDGAFRRTACQGVEPVAATAPPRPRRWQARGEAIRRAIDPQVRAVAERLGYGAEDDWI